MRTAQAMKIVLFNDYKRSRLCVTRNIWHSITRDILCKQKGRLSPPFIHTTHLSDQEQGNAVFRLIITRKLAGRFRSLG